MSLAGTAGADDAGVVVDGVGVDVDVVGADEIWEDVMVSGTAAAEDAWTFCLASSTAGAGSLATFWASETDLSTTAVVGAAGATGRVEKSMGGAMADWPATP